MERDTDSAPAGTASADGQATTPIGGGQGTVIAWDQPHLVVTAPDGIGMVTPQTIVCAAGTHTTLAAGQDINTLAGGHHASVAEAGVVLFTYGHPPPPEKPNQETGIALHAASGSVHLGAPGGGIGVAADRRVDVASTAADVLIAAPLHILLTAAGAAIDIQSDSVTLKAPGTIKFKASMKVLTNGSTVTAEYQRRHAAGATTPSKFDDRFVVTNDAGAPLPNRRYTVTRADGTRLSGTTDAQGRIQQQFSFLGERIGVSVKGKA